MGRRTVNKEREMLTKHEKLLAEMQKAVAEKNEKREVEYLKKDQKFLDGEKASSRSFHQFEAQEDRVDQQVEDNLEKVASKDKDRHEKVTKEVGTLRDEWQKLEVKHDELLKKEDSLNLAASRAKYSDVLKKHEKK